jgi:hypothetical protein
VNSYGHALVAVLYYAIFTLMEQSADYKNLQASYQSLRAENELLKAELSQLKRMIFGSKSEQFIAAANPSQLSLGIQADAIATTSLVDAKKIAYTRVTTQATPAAHPVRMKLPDHLERKGDHTGA